MNIVYGGVTGTNERHRYRRQLLTKAGCKQLRVEVGEELLALRVELAHSRDNVARRADADNLHDSLEDEQGEVGEVGMRAVLVALEDIEHAIVAVLVRLRGHGDEIRGVSGRAAQAQGLGSREERHADARGVVGKARGRDGHGNTRLILKRTASWLRTRYGRRSTSQPAPSLAERQVEPRALQELYEEV